MFAGPEVSANKQALQFSHLDRIPVNFVTSTSLLTLMSYISGFTVARRIFPIPNTSTTLSRESKVGAAGETQEILLFNLRTL